MPDSRSSMQRLRVTVVSPDGHVVFQKEFRPPDTVSLGRSSESDIALEGFGSKISRCHAVLLHDGESWEYYNLGVNGTYEYGRKIDTRLIESGTVLRMGKRGPILQFVLRDPGSRVAQDSHVLEDDTESSREASDVTGLIHKVRRGDELAAQQLWDKYSEQILNVARRSLQGESRRVQDEEDVAVIAFKSLLAGISSGRFPELDDRDQLWRMMMVITTRKAAAVIEKDHRQKRGGGEVRGDSAVTPGEKEGSVLTGFDRLTSENPAPDIAAVVADQTHQLLATLPDETARQIAVFKMEGYTHEEIADKLDVNVRTVERRLKQIRELWQRVLNDDE
ncbi:MAG: ECF-type sigma factor [Planctomycetota bacterium]|nr:ECF-type sigma factor [Planctomycetota bacterium]MDA1163621.1 ECF-type sigma factor [Planctomycetota bacterium]